MNDIEQQQSKVELDRPPTVGDAFVLIRNSDDESRWSVHCSECEHRYGGVEDDPKLGAVLQERSISDLSALNSVGMKERLVARQFFCPSCALLIAVNVQQHGDPIMLEWRLDPETLSKAR